MKKPMKHRPKPRREPKRTNLPPLEALLARFRAGARHEIEADLLAWTRSAPQQALAWNLLCALLRERGAAKEAWQVMQQAAQALPRDANILNNLALALYENAQYAAAAATLKKAVDLAPGLAAAHNNLGNALMALGEKDAAETSYLNALHHHPQFADATYNLANLLKSQGRNQEALLRYREALALNPGSVDIGGNLANLLCDTGQHEESVTLYQQCIDKDPSNQANHYNYAELLFNRGDFDQALEQYRFCEQGVTEMSFVAARSKAITAWLKGELDSCQAELKNSERLYQTLVERLTEQVGGKDALRASWIFTLYLQNLLVFTKQQMVFASESNDAQGVKEYETLHIVGESHALSPCRQRFRWLGQSMSAVSHFVMGVKMYHLGSQQPNKYQAYIAHQISRLPRESHILFTIGEIDCRPDEGIWTAWKKGKGELSELIEQTVSAYVRWLDQVTRVIKPKSLALQGIPAVNYSLDQMSEAEQQRFKLMVRQTNASMKRYAHQQGWGFLDVYTATGEEQGESSQWHLDGFHLRPDFYQCSEQWWSGPAEQELQAPLSEHPARVEDEKLVELFNQGKYAEMEISAIGMTTTYPKHAFGWEILALAQEKLNKFVEAGETYLHALKLAPNSAMTLGNYACFLNKQSRHSDALPLATKATEIDPKDECAWVNRGNALLHLEKNQEAVACYRRALLLAPELAEAHNNLGCALRRIVDCDSEAESHFRRALELKPGYVEAQIGLAETLIDKGDFKIAGDLASKLTVAAPNSPAVCVLLPKLRKMTEADSDWFKKLRGFLSNGVLNLKERIAVLFALGKYCDDTRAYDQAFTYFTEANRLKQELAHPYDQENHKQVIDMLIASHSKDVANVTRSGSSQSSRPLFIVGMPRSGTSLLEQILASHPQTFGAGELEYWGKVARRYSNDFLTANYSEGVLEKVAADCLENLEKRAPKAIRVIDKMPGNFQHLGFIHATFPNARILHTTRNPVDTCLSIYFQDFKLSHEYAQDLNDLAHYYRQYHRLMTHWRSVLPKEAFLDVPYEALIEDQEGWSRKIIEFIGLEWDERCLNFYKTERKVGTASNWQARQPIYKTSKERWRNYEKHVGPLLPLLELYDPERGQL